MSNIVVQVVVDGQILAVAAMTQKDFSTGSRGFIGQVRPTIDGKKYIAGINLVEIGSGKAKQRGLNDTVPTPVKPAKTGKRK